MALLSSNSRKKASNEISSSTGLRIVILPNYSNTIVVKSGLKSLTQTTPIITTYLSNTNTNTNTNNSSYYSSVINYSSAAKNITTTSCSSSFNGGFNSFLKSCHLCKKPLCPDKDVYMYRGDQGFCSIECRSKQIMVDETKEMNANTKNRLRASSIDYCQGCETCKLLEDLRHRRIRRNNKLKPLITPAKHQPFALFLIV